MSWLEGFLSSIAAKPRDDDLWLILADWFDEQGDPRSELVRLQHALRQPGPVPERAAKEQRLRALLAADMQPLVPRLTNSLGMQLVRLSAGTFWMGGGGGKAGEKQVVIPHVFCIGVYPVTQGEWQALMGNTPSSFSRTGGGAANVEDISDDDLKLFPVEQVSWNDAQEFLKRLNARETDGAWVYRLPTEAEWEYACRGGAVSEDECSYHFYLDLPSNSLSSTQANFLGIFPEGGAAEGPFLRRTSRVGSYKPNRLGIFDLHGNVYEWCNDAQGSERVIRGGSFYDHGSGCRAAARSSYALANRSGGLGLRLARVPSDSIASQPSKHCLGGAWSGATPRQPEWSEEEMASNVYDQAGRYLAKLDPAGFLAYVLELVLSAFRFCGWLDTRLLPFPGQPDRTCDTVAHLEDLARGGIPWALILEFQIDPVPEMFGRFLGYGGLVWEKKKPSEERGDRFEIGAAVVNFRGRGKTSREMKWPEAGLGLGLQVKECNVAGQDAAAALSAIKTGQLARVVLPLVPLMQGGDRDDNIQEWVRVASAETDPTRRGDWGGLALVFAEAAGCWQTWKDALKEWNVIQSQQVLEWQAQARTEARIETLVEFLEGRFGTLSEALVQKLRALTDPAVLKRLVRTAAQAASLDDFSQSLPH